MENIISSKRAFITGVNGQDGILLSKLLLAKGYEVAGAGSQTFKSLSLDSNVGYTQIDICQTEKIMKIVNEFRPNEFYNLASISSVSRSFEEPERTWDVNSRAVDALLLRLFQSKLSRNLRFFQACSSEMFGLSTIEPQTENVPFHPVSPYAESKVAAMKSCIAFRGKGFFVSCGIMYNHESIYRPKKFVTRKITSGVAEIKQGCLSKIQIGNIYAERDWGYAGDYVEAMWLMLQSNQPDDFVIATGLTHSVRDILSIAFDEAGLLGRELEFLELNPNLLRSREINRLVGDFSKIRQNLGWFPRKDFETLIREMVAYDISMIN